MTLDPTLVGLLGLVIFALGLLMKHYGWRLQDRALLWAIVGISVLGGIAQVIISAQTTPFPPLPADPAQIVFVWIPTVLGWIAASAGAIFAASQAIYALIIKGLAPSVRAPDA